MRRIALALIALIALLLPPLAAAEPPGHETEAQPPARPKAQDSGPGITREQADAILQELRSIRLLLEKQAATPARLQPAPAPPPPPRVKVSIPPAAAATAIGKKEAPVTIVEFTDFQCPYCQRHQDATLPQLRERYVDTGTVRYVSRDLPLEMHANALLAARAGRCAAAQGRYWDLRRAMFANARQLSAPELTGHARAAGLDIAAFETCIADQSADARIRSEAAEVAPLGITGTPSFVIGRTTEGAIEGVLIVGAQPLAAFEARITEALGRPPAVAAPSR